VERAAVHHGGHGCGGREAKTAIGRTALLGFLGSRHRTDLQGQGQGPLDPQDGLSDLSGFSEGFQRPFMEQPQYMSLTMSGLAQAPMRAGLRAGLGPWCHPLLAALPRGPPGVLVLWGGGVAASQGQADAVGDQPADPRRTTVLAL